MSAPFSFKQFKIDQDTAPFKVGTDGVLLGAWVEYHKPKQILDVGTGTGLIALMCAQRFADSNIFALDVNQEATKWSRKNFKNSKWHNRLSLIHSSFQDYQSTEKFDIIVCNPPFFSSSKLGESDDQNLARHQIFFSPFDFIKFSSIHISNKGVVAVIAPYEHYNKWLKPTLFFGMNLKRKCVVYPTPKSTPKRVLLEFTFDTVKTVETSLVIEQKRHFYTSETAALLKDFYLKL